MILDNGLKALVIAAGVFITCVLLNIGFYFLRESKGIAIASGENLSEFAAELSESNITMYDGLELTGSDVVNFVKKQLGEYNSTETAPVYVYVKTVKDTVTLENTYYNGENIDNIQNFTHVMYIKPTGKFVGKVVRDENKVIIGVNFIQH